MYSKWKLQYWLSKSIEIETLLTIFCLLQCGTKPDMNGKFYENNIVIQYDKDLIEVWDEAKRLRCEWYNDYEKGITKPPIRVSDLEVVELNFRGENENTWIDATREMYFCLHSHTHSMCFYFDSWIVECRLFRASVFHVSVICTTWLWPPLN